MEQLQSYRYLYVGGVTLAIGLSTAGLRVVCVEGVAHSDGDDLEEIALPQY